MTTTPTEHNQETVRPTISTADQGMEILDSGKMNAESKKEIQDGFINVLTPLVENHNSLVEAGKTDGLDNIAKRIIRFFVLMVSYGPEAESVRKIEESVKDETLRGDLQSIREQAIADREDLARHAEYMEKVKGMEFMTRKKLDAIPEPEPMKPIPSLQEVIEAKKAAGLSTFTSPNDELIIDAVDPTTVTHTTEEAAVEGEDENGREAEVSGNVETSVVSPVAPAEDETLKAAEAVRNVAEETEDAGPDLAQVVEQPAAFEDPDKVSPTAELGSAPAVETTKSNKLTFWERILKLRGNLDTSQVAGVGPNGPLVEEENK